MELIEYLIEECKKKTGAYEARPFGEYPICYKVMGKIFAQIMPNENRNKMTVKCTPERGQEYRMMYPDIVVRGYHCPPVQQPYNNTIDLDKLTDRVVLSQMIDESYDAVVTKLTRKDKQRLQQMADLEFLYTDGENADFALLCKKLDNALDELVGAKFQRQQYDQYNQRDTIHDVIVVYQNRQPVACGSYKMYDDEHAELKRIYTDDSVRGMGVGMDLVRRLEADAKMKGYSYCILETGEPMKAAIQMYQKLGYKVIENYGQYVDMPDSICMQRKI